MQSFSSLIHDYMAATDRVSEMLALEAIYAFHMGNTSVTHKPARYAQFDVNSMTEANPILARSKAVDLPSLPLAVIAKPALTKKQEKLRPVGLVARSLVAGTFLDKPKAAKDITAKLAPSHARYAEMPSGTAMINRASEFKNRKDHKAVAQQVADIVRHDAKLARQITEAEEKGNISRVIALSKRREANQKRVGELLDMAEDRGHEIEFANAPMIPTHLAGNAIRSGSSTMATTGHKIHMGKAMTDSGFKRKVRKAESHSEPVHVEFDPTVTLPLDAPKPFQFAHCDAWQAFRDKLDPSRKAFVVVTRKTAKGRLSMDTKPMSQKDIKRHEKFLADLAAWKLKQGR